MPSRDEGFGFVFVEAMRAARACVGSRGAAAEIIADGDTGLLVEPGDRAQLLAGAWCALLRDRPRPRRWARAGARGSCSSSPRSGFATASWRCCRWRREHSRPQRLPRRRVGGARARRPARRRGRGRALSPHQARRRLSAAGDAAPAWRWAASRRPTSTCSPCRAIRARICCARPGSCCGTGRGARWRRARATWSACARCPTTIADALGARRGARAAARCDTSSIIRRTWPARRSSRRSTRRRSARSTASATSSARRGAASPARA